MRALVILAFAAIQGVPWKPETRPDQFWIDRHNEFVQNTALNAANITVVFYGDSITEGWLNNGINVWQQRYQSLGAVDYGIGGDRTEHLLWRIQNGEVLNLKPKLVVLNIGTNNKENTEADTVRGIEAVVNLLKQRLPSAKILLLGILPRSDYDAFQRIATINIAISKFADNQQVYWLNMFDQFSQSWGNVDPNLFTTDKLHLVTAGYQKWAETMESTFDRLVNQA